MKFNSFIKKFQEKKNVAIFTHDNPDPDCLASSLLLDGIAKKLKVRTKIFYGGQLSRSENKAMVEQLKIKLHPISELDKNKFDGFAIVDTQKHFANNSIPADITPDFTFDHHGNDVPRSHFFDIDTKAGATSTILLQYFLKLGLKPSSKIATAYCYALISETKDLDRGATARDIRYFNKCYPQSDLKILSKIRHAKKPQNYFDTLKLALNKYQVKNKVLTCFLGDALSADHVSELADVFIQMEEIEYSLVIGKCKHTYLVSSRTSKKNVDLGGILHRVIKNYGSAGGHDMIAAGQFQGNPETIIKSFIEIVKNS